MSVSWSTFRAEDGTERTLNHVVRYAFHGDKLQSETEYTDSTMMIYLDQVFDDEFRSCRGSPRSERVDAQTEAAIDAEGLAGDVRGLLGREESARERNLVE